MVPGGGVVSWVFALELIAVAAVVTVTSHAMTWLLQRNDQRRAQRRIREAEAAATEAWAVAHRRIAMDAVVVSRQMREQLGPALVELAAAVEEYAAAYTRTELDSMQQQAEQGLEGITSL